LPTAPRTWLATAGWLLALGLLGALALAGGCTSDDANPVGVGLVETEIDTVLQPLNLDQVSRFGVLDVFESGNPLDERDVLYLGADSTGNRSSILTNYDFAALDHPDSAEIVQFLQPDNMLSAEIVLYMLTYYFPNHGADLGDVDPDTLARYWPGSQKYYDVHELTAPFDTLSYPGPEPSFLTGRVNEFQSEPLPADGPLFVQLDVDIVSQWIADRREVGIIVRQGTGSQTGMLGFASKEMKFGGSTLPQLNEAVTLGVALRVRLLQTPDRWPTDRQYWVLGPAADVSTWHQVDAPPTDVAEGILFRTHLRSYPMLYFDLAPVPDGVRINRALLSLTTDVSRTYGQRQTMAVSEVDPLYVPPGITTVELNDIPAAINFIAGRSGLDTEDPGSDLIELDVTSSVQRWVNGAYDGIRGFLLTAGEDFIPSPYNESPDPDFWFSQRTFYGTAAADSAARPRLKITYSRDDAIDGGQP